MDSNGDSGKKKKGFIDLDREIFRAPEVIPDTLNVPPNTIYLVADGPDVIYNGEFDKCPGKRDWFTNFFYFCLPIVFGNQHGFLLRATHSFVCRWSGSDEFDGVDIHLLEEEPYCGLTYQSHFGSGILTVQSHFSLRTPENVNLMVKAPPNYPVHGMSWMDAVVETDNLRRDFTFNIKITRPNVDIFVEKGTPLGCVVPYPRYFIDKYEMKLLEDKAELAKSIKTVNYFTQERLDYDRDQPRLRYMEGKDIYDLAFKEHQKSLDSGAWWRAEKDRVQVAGAAAGKAGLSAERTAYAPHIYGATYEERSMLNDPSIAHEKTAVAQSNVESLPPEMKIADKTTMEKSTGAQHGDVIEAEIVGKVKNKVKAKESEKISIKKSKNKGDRPILSDLKKSDKKRDKKKKKKHK